MVQKKEQGLLSESRFMKWVKTSKGQRILLGAGLVGILLIGISSFLPKSDSAQPSAAASSSKKTEDYIADMEARLSTIVGSIEGAGQCQVMVTLENGVEYVYASEQRVNTDRQEDSSRVSQRDDSENAIIIVDTEDGKQGLLVTEIQPTVKGVVVVCEGGDQALVQQRIINTITTALNISSKRVCVTKLSNSSGNP